MVNLIYLSELDTTTIVQEGLPFWLFWLLIAFIGLLLFFIFLRDKDLRRRIDFFFLGAKSRSLQVHLRRQMKKEKKKKERLWLDLGRIVYEQKLVIDGTEAILRSLDSLERKKQQILNELNYLQNNLIIAQTETSSSPLVDQRLTSEVSFSSKINLDKSSPKSKATWQKKGTNSKKKIKDLEEQADHFMITLGRIADTLRFKNEKLVPIYEKIDSVNLKLSHLEQRLDSLHPF